MADNDDSNESNPGPSKVGKARKRSIKKKQLAEKSSPIDINERGWDQVKIIAALTDKTMRVGPPPEHKKVTSDVWKKGMKYIYEGDEEVPYWYFCTLCNKAFNTNLMTGQSNLLNHVNKHDNDKYQLSVPEMVSLCEKIYEHSKESDQMPKFNEILPVPAQW